MVRCTATTMTQSQQIEIADMRVTSYDEPPLDCKYLNKLNGYLTEKLFDKALRRIQLDRPVKIEGPDRGISQAHRIPREVECKSEPLFRVPLHTALYYNAPYDVIEALVEHYPGALKEESIADSNFLPLHMACTPRTMETLEFLPIDENREKIISYLIDKYSPAVSRPEPEQNASILNLVCEHQPPKSLVVKILKTNSNLVREEDNQGNIPLHSAIDYHACHRIVKALLKIDSQGVLIKRKFDGHLPLHCAAFNNCSFRVLKCLLQKEFAETVEIVNSAGETALHMAFDRFAENWKKRTGEAVKDGCLSIMDFIETLLKSYAYYVYDEFGRTQGEKKIVHLIKRKHDNQSQTIMELMEKCDKKYRLPNDLKTYLTQIADGESTVEMPCNTSENKKRTRGQQHQENTSNSNNKKIKLEHETESDNTKSSETRTEEKSPEARTEKKSTEARTEEKLPEARTNEKSPEASSEVKLPNEEGEIMESPDEDCFSVDTVEPDNDLLV